MRYLLRFLLVSQILYLVGFGFEHNDVAFELFQKIAQTENTVCAPGDLVDSLTILYFGASGKTEVEFSKSVFGDCSKEELIEYLSATETISGYRSVSSIWYSERLQLLQTFKATISENTDCYFGRVPLRQNPEAAAQSINYWYAEQTNGSIRRVLEPDDVVPQSDLLHLTVSAFSAPWADDYFKTRETKPETFYPKASEPFGVSMMETENSFLYSANQDSQILQLQYSDSRMRLLLVLPNESEGAGLQFDDMNTKWFEKSLKALKPEHVRLHLPKVNFQTQINWANILKEEMLPSAFKRSAANFIWINANRPEPLYVSQMTQRTWIRWNEWGTRAGSLTRTAMDPFGPSPEPLIVMKLNRPFAFILYSEDSKNIYFIGVINSGAQFVGFD